MAKRKKGGGGAKSAAQPTDARMRYNVEREPLHGDRTTSRIQIPTQRTGWDGPRRRRMAAWLGVAFIIVILLIGSVSLFYFDQLWDTMIGRWR